MSTKDAAPKNPAITNSGVSNALGIDWSTWSKPNCGKDFDRLTWQVLQQFRTSNEKVWWGHGYKGQDVALYGRCVWRGESLLVDLPGQAMEVIRDSFKVPDAAVCRWFLERGFRATRIDIALDTTEPSFNPFVALKYWHQGLARCVAHKWNFRLGRLQPGKPILPLDGKGMTTYVGTPQTSRHLRIYDKVTEALDKHGEVLTDGKGCEIPHLTRLELQHRDECAEKVSEMIAAEGIEIVPKLIAGYVTFLSHRDPRQRERKRVASWWRRIVGNKKRALELVRGAATPNDSILWIRKQALITLHMIKRKAPDVWERITKLVESAIVRPGVEDKWEDWRTAREKRRVTEKQIAEWEHEERVLNEICYGKPVYEKEVEK